MGKRSRVALTALQRRRAVARPRQRLPFGRLLLPVDPFGKVGVDVEELPNYQAGAAS